MSLFYLTVIVLTRSINVEALAIFGNGTHTLKNGDDYSGEWIIDKNENEDSYGGGKHWVFEERLYIPHGNGTLTFANGGFYEGEFVHGLRHGNGTQIFAKGHRYEGEWDQDRRSALPRRSCRVGDT